MTRVAVAGVFHETNTFSTVPTGMEAFRAKLWADGEDLADAYVGTRTVVGGFLDGARRHGFDVVPVFGAYATPSGPVTAKAFDAITDALIGGLRTAQPFDGLLLELHGAMVVDGDPDPETTLLSAVREVVGGRPVAAVTDFHANVTAERVRLLDVLTGYRTNPHIDTPERGAAAAGLLAAVLRGELTTVAAHRRVPVLAAPIAQGTGEEPLRGLLERARELERRRGLADVTVHGGYAYADVPHAGMSVVATAGVDDGRVEEVADELAALAWERRGGFAVHLPDAAEAFARAHELARDGGPVGLADTGDNINGGSAGDGTWLLHETFTHPGVRVAATLCDPEAVGVAEAAGVGASIACQVGGRSSPMAGPPLALEAVVRWLGDGTFVNTGPMGRGASTSMGRCAVLSAGALDLLVQSLPVQPNDPELFRCTGLDPVAYDIVVLKGARALRAAWDELVTAFVDAGTDGPTMSDLRQLTYTEVLRPVWPLDDPES